MKKVKLIMVFTYLFYMMSFSAFAVNMPNISTIDISSDDIPQANSQEFINIVDLAVKRDKSICCLSNVIDSDNITVALISHEHNNNCSHYVFNSTGVNFKIVFHKPFKVYSFAYNVKTKKTTNFMIENFDSNHWIQANYCNVNLSGCCVLPKESTTFRNSNIKNITISYNDNVSDEQPHGDDDSTFWDKLLDFVKSIFIPSDDFFTNWFNKLNKQMERITNGFTSIFDTLNSFWDKLKNCNVENSLIFEAKGSALYSGSPYLKVDLLKSALPYLKYIRPIITAVFLIATIRFVLIKIKSLLHT